MTYDFHCPGCLNKFSELYLSRDEAEKNELGAPCPKCGTMAIRLIGQVAVKFEGEGWTPRGNL